MANSNGWGDGASNNDIGWGQGADNAIGWGSIYANSWAGATDIVGTPAVDPDAQAFITAASITDPTQQSAINQLVVDLKGYGIWTKMKALYPFVGGTSSTHKWNLKDPRDLDAAFRLVFNGGWTHSVNGAISNGTNAFADSKLNSNTIFGSNYAHQSIYLRNNTNLLVVTGVTDSLTNRFDFGYDINKVPFHAIANLSSSLGSTDTRTDGFLLSFRTGSTTGKYKRNNVDKITSLPSFSQYPSFNYYIGARNAGGVAALFNNQELAFASIGDGLTDTEAANLYTAVQAFQTTLGRSIGTQTVSDADAQAFVTNAGIVDQVEANAINNLVIGLKADGLWTKMKAIYPFVGGTSTTNKYNLKNPLDTDAAFRLVFNGGWTHSSTGITPNGVNGWADTKLIAQGTLGLNSTHVSVYSRTNLDRNAPSIGNLTGGASAEVSMWLRSGGSAFLRVNNPTSSSTTSNDSRGLFIGNRNSSTQIDLSIRGTQTTFNQNSNSLSVNVMQLGGVSPNFFDTKELAFASIGDGLTSQNMTDLTTRVTTFQTTLNRNV